MFYPAGTKVRFLNRNGYEYEREHASNIFDVSRTYTVKTCAIGNWKSSYSFEEVDGRYNTVMFAISES